jgi:hypothetical protein
MAIEALLKIRQPLADAAGRGTPAGWVVVEQQLGTRLPTDYKQFITHFGSDFDDEFLIIYSPFAEKPFAHLLHAGAGWLTALKTTHGAIGQIGGAHDLAEEERQTRVYPYPVYPEPDGLLPWGTTTNFGDVLLWQTAGDPDTWTVMVANLRDDQFERYPCAMTEFLTRLLLGQTKSEILPDDYPSGGDEG